MTDATSVSVDARDIRDDDVELSGGESDHCCVTVCSKRHNIPAGSVPAGRVATDQRDVGSGSVIYERFAVAKQPKRVRVTRKQPERVRVAEKQPPKRSPPTPGPKLKQNLVVFLDLLGFREKMRTAAAAGTSQTLLTEYDRAVGSALNILEDSEGLDGYRYRGFTDNFVMAVPALNLADAETALGYLLIRIAEFQLLLASRGWFLRGAITYGDFHIDDRLVFGTPVVEAYELESQRARDPRIILSKEVAAMAVKHLGYYADPFKSPHNGYLLQDVDGHMFVNYLYTPIGGDAGESARKHWVEQHKLQVETMLSTHQSSPAVWSKYRWVAAYHDYFCKKWGDASGKLLKISRRVLRSEPELLVARSNGASLE